MVKMNPERLFPYWYALEWWQWVGVFVVVVSFLLAVYWESKKGKSEIEIV
ncbi:MAG: hypothetical protein L6408_06445 [Nanoarchaeota archaeon]|nr:hypothetical protein [Nanoarchaeota archaeon]